MDTSGSKRVNQRIFKKKLSRNTIIVYCTECEKKELYEICVNCNGLSSITKRYSGIDIGYSFGSMMILKGKHDVHFVHGSGHCDVCQLYTKRPNISPDNILFVKFLYILRRTSSLIITVLSTFYTTLSHNLIRKKFSYLIEWFLKKSMQIYLL